MIDSKLAGTGNSRFLKSVSNFKTLYPTYDDFVAALVAGTLPIDLNGINPDGWTQQGTPLNKANLLSDDVANGLGLVDDATPNGAFNAIISAKGKSNGFATLDSSGKVPSEQLNLSSSVSSTSTTTAANSAAVKTAYDKATTTDYITVDKIAECSKATVTVSMIHAVRAGQIVLVSASLDVNPTSQSDVYHILFPGLPKLSGDKSIGFASFIHQSSYDFPYDSTVEWLANDNNNTAGFYLHVKSAEEVTIGTTYNLAVNMIYSV